MKTCIIAIFCFSTIFSYGQDNRFIRSVKFTPYAFGEVMYAPISITRTRTEQIYNGSTVKDSVINTYNRPVTVSLLSLIYSFRFNLYESSINKAIGVNFSPSFGFAMSDYGTFTINLPTYLTYNFGAGATLTSEESSGGYFGVGYEFNMINLTEKTIIEMNSSVDDVEPQNFWHQPMLITGFRWLSQKGKLWEISFKYGWSSDQKDIPKNVKNEIGRKPQTFQIGFGWIFR